MWDTAEKCEVFEPKANGSSDSEPDGRPERFYHISQLAALPPPKFLIDKLYVEKTFNLHYGPPKSGKTHMAPEPVPTNLPG